MAKPLFFPRPCRQLGASPQSFWDLQCQDNVCGINCFSLQYKGQVLWFSNSGASNIELAMRECLSPKPGCQCNLLPCDLLMVMANAGFTGNCLLHHSNRYTPGFGIRMILGTKTFLSEPMTEHWRTLLSNTFSNNNFVPLHNPSLGLRFPGALEPFLASN